MCLRHTPACDSGAEVDILASADVGAELERKGMMTRCSSKDSTVRFRSLTKGDIGYTHDLTGELHWSGRILPVSPDILPTGVS